MEALFAIGKELGELKARVEQLEDAGCGCKGKKENVGGRSAVNQQTCEKLKALHPKILAAVSSALAAAAKDAGFDGELTLQSYVLSTTKASPREICCYYCRNGDYCCGDCNDPFCRNC
jgi:hypothetical protein